MARVAGYYTGLFFFHLTCRMDLEKMFYYVLGGVHRPDTQYYYYYYLLLLIQQKKIGGHNYSVLLFLHSVGLPSGLDF